MATGASTADLAVLLIDARKGILTQTRRHAFIATLLGIRHVVLAVNKMDLSTIRRHVFDEIDRLPRLRRTDRYRGFRSRHPDVRAGATTLSSSGPRHPGTPGPTLLEHLETVDIVGIRDETRKAGFRMPVQWVNRPNLDFRGFAGLIAAGAIRPGDASRCCRRQGDQPGQAAIVTMDGDLEPRSRASPSR
jgi:bifunctional enzyme CysN/CysC